MNLTPDLIKRVEDSYLFWIDKANKLFGFNHIPELKLEECSIRSRAGEANLNFVRLSPFFLIQNTEEMLNQTIPHEIAHSIQVWKYPHAKQWHGPEWKGIMRAMGLQPTRCHSFDVSNNLKRHVPRGYMYFCPDCNQKFNLTIILHNKIIKGQYRICLKCKKRLLPMND
jgi:predicted SprT family Zn-dependent metalloprotease